jgi:hypothetical protein
MWGCDILGVGVGLREDKHIDCLWNFSTIKFGGNVNLLDQGRYGLIM